MVFFVFIFFFLILYQIFFVNTSVLLCIIFTLISTFFRYYLLKFEKYIAAIINLSL